MSSRDELPMILCCICGMSIQSNPTNMCANCLKGRVDITEDIAKQVIIFFCHSCGRYLRPPWIHAELESKEMLALCLKKVKGLGKGKKLVDASFVWTEPHSRRIKIKLTVQQDVFASAIVQQSCVVEFVVQNQQCPDCQKSFTEHTWGAVIQLRQKVAHKRTFFWLEQLMLKHKIAEKANNIKEQPDGLDIYWDTRNNAHTMINFVSSVVPVRSKQSKRLISQDFSSNTTRYKFNLFVEIAPICKDDLVVLPRRLAIALGGVSPLLLCYKITSLLHFIDPFSLRRVELNADKYWRDAFDPLLSSRRLIEYTVLDVEVASPYSVNPHEHNSPFQLADVQVVRSSDFGVNDQSYQVLTHLGHLLKPSDTVLGYDLATTNFNENALTDLKEELPDVVLVKKCFAKADRAKSRKFKLQHLAKEVLKTQSKHESKRMEDDYEDFLQEVEETPEMWEQMQMFKRGADKQSTGQAEEEEDSLPVIPLTNLMDEMAI